MEDKMIPLDKYGDTLYNLVRKQYEIVIDRINSVDQKLGIIFGVDTTILTIISSVWAIRSANNLLTQQNKWLFLTSITLIFISTVITAWGHALIGEIPDINVRKFKIHGNYMSSFLDSSKQKFDASPEKYSEFINDMINETTACVIYISKTLNRKALSLYLASLFTVFGVLAIVCILRF